MNNPELFISAQCVKVTVCTNIECKKLNLDIISPDNDKYNSDKEFNGYLIEYKGDFNIWREKIDKYIKYSDVANNPLAQQIFNLTKNL